MLVCEIEFRNKSGDVEQFDTSSEFGESKEILKKRASKEFHNFCKEMGIMDDCVLGCKFREYPECKDGWNEK